MNPVLKLLNILNVKYRKERKRFLLTLKSQCETCDLNSFSFVCQGLSSHILHGNSNLCAERPIY
jgi:hypothetical protein